MTLHRYILGQLAWPALAALLALNGLFLVLQLLKIGEVTFSSALDWSELLRISFLFLPGFAVLTIPVAVLTGVLLGFGRMAEDGELVALASGGISAWRLLPVPLGLGLLAGLMAFGMAGWGAPAAAAAQHRSFVDLAKRHVVASLQPGRFFEEIPRIVLYPRKAGEQPGSFDGFMLYDHRPGRTRHALLARRARVIPADDGNHLELRLEDGEVHARHKKDGMYSLARFESASIAVDIDRLVYDRTRFISPTERYTLSELMSPETVRPGGSKQAFQQGRRWVAVHRRFALPGACLVFALLGTALVASGRLRGRRHTLVAAVVVVAVYYVLMRLGDGLLEPMVQPAPGVARYSGLVPAAVVWAPNVLLSILVLGWMFRRGRVPG